MTSAPRRRVQKQFVSPLMSRSKEPHTEGGTCMLQTGSREGSEARSSLPVEPTSLEALPCGVQCSGELETLVEERRALHLQLETMKEHLRKLQMVKTYRHKAGLEELAALSSKWRMVAQEAAELLLTSTHVHPPPSMAQLLSYLHIDHNLIHYSLEDEAFY